MVRSIWCIANGSGSRLYHSKLELDDPTDSVALDAWVGGKHRYVVELGELGHFTLFAVKGGFLVYERLEVSG